MWRRVLSVSVAAILLASCAREQQEAAAAPETAKPAADAPPPAAPASFAEVDQALKSGSFDDAAARLLEMRVSGRDFNPKDAAEYRQKLNEAYSAALEAADKGDARAKAALEMIRANRGR